MSSLYFHIPFCERKCIYCDFYSIENHSSMLDFLGALGREIQAYAAYGAYEKVETIFFGGGTPSLLTPDQLHGILRMLTSTFTLTPDPEITLEANPGTVDAEKLSAYRSLGVNRLSIGMQSFHDDELRFLGRIHTREQAIQCFALAREAGFQNVSIDLIFSLPGQRLGQWEENLNQAVALNPEHLSVYSLIVEEQTPLARMVSAGQVAANPIELEAEFYEFAMRFLADHGFEQYEVSNFAKHGYRSRHNANYWAHGNYLGFGPSAHSFWEVPGQRSGRRWWNFANVQQYCGMLADNRLPVASEEMLDADDLVRERIFLGLRSEGVHLGRLHTDFGFELLRHQHDIIMNLVDQEFAVLKDHALRLTPRGYLLCDEICARLLP
jgi:oxygen-independent coproporphyrinogen-3 oxidase